MTILWLILGLIVGHLHIQAYRPILDMMPLPVRLLVTTLAVVVWPVQVLPLIWEIMIAYNMQTHVTFNWREN